MEIDTLVIAVVLTQVLIPMFTTAFFGASLALGIESSLMKQWATFGGVAGVYVSLSGSWTNGTGPLQYFGAMLMQSGIAAGILLLLLVAIELPLHWILARGRLESQMHTVLRGAKICLAVFLVGVTFEYIGSALRII